MKYNHVISLGSVCFTSWMCKELQLKKFSCPFDWIFSEHNELGPYFIITDCIKDNFECFLDQSQYKDNIENVRSASHTKYGNIFLHHDPRTAEDHNYFKRCVSRFKNVCKSEENVSILFVLTFVNKSTHHVEELIRKIPVLIDALKQYVKPKFTVLIFIHVNSEKGMFHKNIYFMKNLYNNQRLLQMHEDTKNKEFIFPNENCICKTIYTSVALRGYNFKEKEINDKFTSYVRENFEFDLY